MRGTPSAVGKRQADGDERGAGASTGGDAARTFGAGRQQQHQKHGRSVGCHMGRRRAFFPTKAIASGSWGVSSLLLLSDHVDEAGFSSPVNLAGPFLLYFCNEACAN